MPKGLRKHQLAVPDATEPAVIPSVKKQKLAVLLVTDDETLWPQIGAGLGADLVPKQLDSIDELISNSPAGQPAIVLWDARNHTDPAAVLSRLHLHSSRFAIIALDNASSANAWKLPIQHRQVVAHVSVPIAADALADAIENAQEEVNSRLALLGDGASPLATPSAAAKKTWLLPAIIGSVVAAAIAVFVFTRPDNAQTQPPAATASVPVKAPSAPPAAKSPAETDEKLDALIEKAQQAMLDRHFIDPVSGSALSLYREALIMDPDNGEARQGLQRLSEILIARVQSALDDHKFDVALQSLETARSIDASDRRLAALDEKIASMRAELGPAQIVAALNAQNFDRASQLIDEATRAKSLSPAKLAQLRDEVRRHHQDFDVDRLLKLVDARLQQDHVIEPHNDNAVYYLEQAKQAGASAADLQSGTQELLKRLPPLAHTAIEQHHLSDVDRMLAEMHAIGAPAATIAAVQRELTVARAQQASQKSDQPQYLELAQARLSQGKLTEPDNDSALYYFNQLRSADPKNSGLAQLAGALQSQILDRARAALDAGDMEKSEALGQMATGIGASSDLDSFNEKLRDRKTAVGDLPQMPEQTLTRANKLDLQYPSRALQANIEGWVEIAFTVAANGSVKNVRVLNATPANVFDTAASKAVSRLRYKPVMQDGKAIAIDTQLRIVFRVPK